MTQRERDFFNRILQFTSRERPQSSADVLPNADRMWYEFAKMMMEGDDPAPAAHDSESCNPPYGRCVNGALHEDEIDGTELVTKCDCKCHKQPPVVDVAAVLAVADELDKSAFVIGRKFAATLRTAVKANAAAILARAGKYGYRNNETGGSK